MRVILTVDSHVQCICIMDGAAFRNQKMSIGILKTGWRANRQGTETSVSGPGPCSDDIAAFRNICSFTMGIYDPHFQHHRASNLSL
jgi:hypothetical protein